MRSVKVTFSNGNTIVTDINGTDEEITHYYRKGKQFNLGPVRDNIQTVTNLEFI